MDETYSAALVELANAQKQRHLAAFWGDGTTSSSDGQNFRVGSHGRYAGQVNLKYGQYYRGGTITLHLAISPERATS